METSEYIILCMSRVKDMLVKSLDGLTLDQTLIMPGEQSNNIAWLAWHMNRGFDRRISLVSGDDQLWITEKWYESYKLPKSYTTLGIGHTIDDVKSIRHSSTSVPVDYFVSVYEKMILTFNPKQKIMYEKIIPEKRVFVVTHKWPSRDRLYFRPLASPGKLLGVNHTCVLSCSTHLAI